MAFLAPAPRAANAFEVEGRVSVAPPWPVSEVVPVTRDSEHCGAEHVSRGLLVSPEGFLANAVVSLQGVGWTQKSEEAAQPVLNHDHCRFTPHILLVPPGQSFRVANNDPVAHDVRAFEGAQMLFRLELDPRQDPVVTSFPRPGRFTIRCGLHKWMHAFAIQQEHPYYAVTDAAGRYRLSRVPAGTYTLHIWHERLGTAELPVAVPGSSGDGSYVFAPISDRP